MSSPFVSLLSPSGLLRQAVAVAARQPASFGVVAVLIYLTFVTALSTHPSLGWGVTLWLKADGGIDALHDDLAKHGMPIVTAPFDDPFGRTLCVCRPRRVRRHGARLSAAVTLVLTGRVSCSLLMVFLPRCVITLRHVARFPANGANKTVLLSPQGLPDSAG
jgi:hypothetical protein